MDWMKMVIKVFEEVGEGEIIDLIEEGKETKAITKKIKGAVNVKLEQKIQSKWARIDSSQYYKEYKEKRRGIKEKGRNMRHEGWKGTEIYVEI